MANTIKIKQSAVLGKVPTTSDLLQGELALNTNDQKLYTKNSSGAVVELGRIPAINDVSDIVITSPQDGQILRYEASSGKWKNFVLPNIPTFSESGSAPSNPTSGDTWYDTTHGLIQIRVSGSWITLADVNELVSYYDGGTATTTSYSETVNGGVGNTTTYNNAINGGDA